MQTNTVTGTAGVVTFTTAGIATGNIITVGTGATYGYAVVTGFTSTTISIANTANFIVGNQRGLRIDTQELVETQRRVMVASLRTGMTRVTTNLGNAVTAHKYTAT